MGDCQKVASDSTVFISPPPLPSPVALLHYLLFSFFSWYLPFNWCAVVFPLDIDPICSISTPFNLRNFSQWPLLLSNVRTSRVTLPSTRPSMASRAKAKGGLAAMRGKDAAAQKAAVDEYFKHWDNQVPPTRP